jgi:hypothetical protein
LPEGEHHEIGLLTLFYLLRKKRQALIYLGANVPAQDMAHLVSIRRPKYIAVHLTTPPKKSVFQKFLDGILRSNAETRVLLSGSGAHSPTVTGNPSVKVFSDFAEVQAFINSL